MTGFALKLIALFTMFLDHGTHILYMYGKIGIVLYYLLRGIGRIAFPIYCFLISEGFMHTSNRRKYAMRLMLLALLSQIPFTLSFCTDNYYGPVWGTPELSMPGLFYILPALWALVYCLWKRRPFWDTVILLLFILLPGCRLSFGSWVLLDGHMNVFYTLAIGLIFISLTDSVFRKSLELKDAVFLLPLAAGMLLIISPSSDYGIKGIVLIFGLFILHDSRILQSLFMTMWALVKYDFSFPGILYCFFIFLASVAVFYYNGKRGPGLKYFFYGFYPIHLLLLRLISLCI